MEGEGQARDAQRAAVGRARGQDGDDGNRPRARAATPTLAGAIASSSSNSNSNPHSNPHSNSWRPTDRRQVGAEMGVNQELADQLSRLEGGVRRVIP
eukprot:COSAG01_NODE_11190_length_1984_cov_1.339163_2_plen_97_part_00